MPTPEWLINHLRTVQRAARIGAAALAGSPGSCSKFSLWFLASSFSGRLALPSSAGNSGKENPAIKATSSLSGGKNGTPTGALGGGASRRVIGRVPAPARAQQATVLLM